MPLDTSIPLQVRQLRGPDQMAGLQNALALKSVMDQQQMNAFTMQKAMRDEQKSASLKNALSGAIGADGQVDHAKVRAALLQSGDPQAALQYDNTIAEQNALKSKREREAISAAREKLATFAGIMGAAKDDATYQSSLQRAASILGPQILQGVPQTYDPQWVESTVGQALTAKERIDAHLESLRFDETKRHNQVSEGLQRDKLAQSGPLALIGGPDGSITAIGGPNGVGPNAAESIGRARGIVKQNEAEGAGTGKYFAERYTDYLKQGDEAMLDNAKLDRIESLLKDVETGKFKGGITELKKAAKAFDIDLEKYGFKDDVAPVEAAQSLAGELTVGAVSAAKLTPVSNADMMAMDKLQPGIEKTPAGRALIIQTRRALNRRKVEMSRLAAKYRKEHGSLDEGWSEFSQDYAEKNPIFSPEAIKSGEYWVDPNGTIRQKP